MFLSFFAAICFHFLLHILLPPAGTKSLFSTHWQNIHASCLLSAERSSAAFCLDEGDVRRCNRQKLVSRCSLVVRNQSLQAGCIIPPYGDLQLKHAKCKSIISASPVKHRNLSSNSINILLKENTATLKIKCWLPFPTWQDYLSGFM